MILLDLQIIISASLKYYEQSSYLSGSCPPNEKFKNLLAVQAENLTQNK